MSIARAVVFTLTLPGACAWTTVAQTYYGAQYRHLAEMLNYTSPVGPYLSNNYGYAWSQYWQAYRLSEYSGFTFASMLSHVWHYPKPVLSKDGQQGLIPSTDGLGGGLAYAWDPNLCDKFLPLFKENIVFVNLIDCNELKMAFSRALSSWANNNRFINFLDVTDECAKMAQEPPHNRDKAEAWKDCPLAEIWVTSVTQDDATSALDTSSGDTTSDGIPIALAQLSARHVSEYGGYAAREGRNATGPEYSKSTSCDPYSTDPQHCFGFTNGIEVMAQDFLELYYVQLAFGTDSTNCWYLDSYFCSGFHQLKASWSPSTVKFTVLIVCLVVMILATFLFLGKLRVFGSCHRRAKRRQNGKNSCSVRKRCSKLYEEASQWSVIGTTLQLIFIIIPPIMYTQIFVVCFDCYDFEGAAVHEIGHALGLGHPNTAREELAYPSPPYLPGDNVYQSLFENGGRMDSNTCLNPWAYVKNNTPPGAEVSDSGCRYPSSEEQIESCTGVRQSVMEAFSQNNPSVCITEDDLEALSTIYPDCELGVSTPVCYRTRLNLGLVRIAAYILLPLIFIMSGLLIFQNCIASSTQEELEELRTETDEAVKAYQQKNKQVLVGRWVTGAKMAKQQSQGGSTTQIATADRLRQQMTTAAHASKAPNNGSPSGASAATPSAGATRAVDAAYEAPYPESGSKFFDRM